MRCYSNHLHTLVDITTYTLILTTYYLIKTYEIWTHDVSAIVGKE